jgi:RNA-directed DNA polymerase
MTAGVDGEVALTDEARSELVARVPQQARTWRPLPVKRTYIPKAGAGHRFRPLGIPVIFDRVLQARAKNALEPEWEARFESRSYGFRPGRGCHDAIEAIFNTLHGRHARRLWILDADLTAAFDRIDCAAHAETYGVSAGTSTMRSGLNRRRLGPAGLGRMRTWSVPIASASIARRSVVVSASSHCRATSALVSTWVGPWPRRLVAGGRTVGPFR